MRPARDWNSSVRFCILGSSSGGNCGLLQTPGSRVLIDAGFSARRTRAMLAAFNQSLDDIDAVFLTHEHSDHVNGLRGLAKLENIKVFATYATSCAVQSAMPEVKIRWQIVERGASFSFGDLTVRTFAVPHDAMDTVGYLFSTGDGSAENPARSLAWMTDLGTVTENAARSAALADILVVEANHDIRMLEESSRPFSLKQRIRSKHGHLSNAQTLEYLKSVRSPRWKHIYLAHISPECNSVGLVREIFGEALDPEGACPISIVDPASGCPDVTEIGPWQRSNPDPERTRVVRQPEMF